MSFFGGKPAAPAPKPESKPVAKPGLFEGGRQVSVKELFQKVKPETTIPGWQKVYKQEYKEVLKKYLPYKQVGTYLKPEEAKDILRKMRSEENSKGLPPSRERRLLEEEWGLKGKYN